MSLPFVADTLSKMFKNKLCYLFPLYIICKVLSIFPITIGIKGPPRFSIIGSSYSLVTAIVYCIYHLSQLKRVKNSNLVGFIIDTYNQHVGSFLVFALIFHGVLKQQKIIDFLKNTDNFDQIFSTNFPTIQINYNKWIRNVSSIIVITVAVLSYMEVKYCLMYISLLPTFSTYCLLMCFVPMFVIIMTEIQFIGYLELLRERFRVINLSILTNNSKWNMLKIKRSKIGVDNAAFFDEIKKIQLICELHTKLDDATTLLNSGFGVRNVLIQMYQFVNWTTLTYDFVMKCVRAGSNVQAGVDYFKETADSGLWAVCFIVEMFAVCLSCDRAAYEGNRIKSLVQFPINDRSLILSRHIKMLTMQLLHRRIEFVQCGLFDINLKLFFSIIGAVSTYIIILIQFDISQVNAPTAGTDNNITTAEANITTAISFFEH